MLNALASIINSAWLNYEFVNNTMRSIAPTCKEYCSETLYRTLGERFWPEVFAPVIDVAKNLTNYEQAIEYLNQGLEYASEIDPYVASAIASGIILVGGAAYYVTHRNGKVVLEAEKQVKEEKAEQKDETEEHIAEPTVIPSVSTTENIDVPTSPGESMQEPCDKASTQVLDNELARINEERLRIREEQKRAREVKRAKAEDEAKARIEKEAQEREAAALRDEKERLEEQQRMEDLAREALNTEKVRLEQEQAERLLAAQLALEEEKRKQAPKAEDQKKSGLDSRKAFFEQQSKGVIAEQARLKDLEQRKKLEAPRSLNLVALTQVQGATAPKSSTLTVKAPEEHKQKLAVNAIVVAYIAYLKSQADEALQKKGRTLAARKMQSQLKTAVEKEVLEDLGLDPSGDAPTSSEAIAHFNQQMVLIGKPDLQMKMPVVYKI